MKARRGLLLAGSLWELVRFFLVLLLFAALLRGVAGAGLWVFPWLLLAGSGNLLVAAGIGMLALFPVRYARLIALLRLGKVMSIFAFILLAVSGAMRPAAASVVVVIGHRGVSGAAVLVGVVIVDLLLLAVLIRWRPGEETRLEPASVETEKLPEYDETEVRNFH
jgi:MFS family permease